MKNPLMHLGLILCTLLLTTACIDDYPLPDESNKYQGELVIEGRICSGMESVFYLTRTTPFTGLLVRVTNAQVRVIGDNGYESEVAADIDNEKYTVNTGKLALDARYAVEIKLDGETYRSDFQPILQSPEIGEISWRETPERLSIHVSSTGNGMHYYMWTFEEDWQFHVLKDMNDSSEGIVVMNPNATRDFYDEFVLGVYNPYYWCFQHETSHQISLYSTLALNEDKIPEVELVSYGTDALKLTSLYSILVHQMALTPEAYKYFSMMKTNTEGDTGGIFATMPNDTRGNVACISNPKIEVRGYVLAADVKEKRAFIYARDFKEFQAEPLKGFYYTDGDKDKDGWWYQKWNYNMNYLGYVAVSPDGTLTKATRLYSRECVDCTAQKDATTTRPPFWPENEPSI